jgi:tetratricopeptide (TPR) repeat protein
MLAAAALLYGAYTLFGAQVFNAFNLRAAEQALEAGDYARAAGLYARILERTPRDEPLRLKVCDLYRDAGNFSRAEYTLLSGLRKAGPSNALYRRLSALFVEQDKLLDAVELLDGIRDSTIGENIEESRPSPPEFSLPSGVYEERIDVGLTADASEIYLSLTGDYPSVLTGLYTAPLPLGPGATRLKAVAVSADGLVSEWAEAEYLLENIIDPVIFADAAMETALRNAIGKPEGQVFTDDLWGIEELILDEGPAGYKSLDDLRHCPRLRILKLVGEHNLTGMENVPPLEFLEELSLDSMGIDSGSLEWVASCANLQRLYLPNNGIGPLSALSALSGLTVLDLRSNSVLDLSPLRGMTGLQYLGLSQNTISDLSPLSALTSLHTLHLDRNRVLSLQGLEGMLRLETLTISYNPVTSLEQVTGLTALAELHASNCQIGALPNLTRLTALRELSVASNGLTGLEGVPAHLRTLNASHNSISSLASLGGLTSLSTLNLSNNQIESVSALRGLPALTTLRVENNLLKSLTPLKECPSLRRVYAFGNSITDPLETWVDSGVDVSWMRN